MLRQKWNKIYNHYIYIINISYDKENKAFYTLDKFVNSDVEELDFYDVIILIVNDFRLFLLYIYYTDIMITINVICLSATF